MILNALTEIAEKGQLRPVLDGKTITLLMRSMTHARLMSGQGLESCC